MPDTVVMRLQQVVLQGFQSYDAEQTVSIDEHVTLLAGRNNVGKSALLRALQIPAACQEGVAGDLCLTYTWSLPAASIYVHAGVSPDGMSDWMISGGDPQPLIVSYTGLMDDGTFNEGPPQISKVHLPSLSASASHGISNAWDQGDFRTNMHEGALNAFASMADVAAKQVLYLAPRRIEQGQRQFSRSTELLPDARNLTEVLLYLSLNERFDVFERVEELMRAAFPDVRGVVLPTASIPGGGSQLQGEPQIQFEGRGEPIPLRLCGTGLEQMLALAVGVLTAKKPRLILVDEPQAYLHPHAERAMLGLLEAHTEHQFIVATHSHTLLGSQPLQSVRLLSLEDGATRVAQVQDEQQVLGELGVSAADLWLVDRILWVEGPTEERVFKLLAANRLSDADRSTMSIRRMPEASRFARSNREAEAIYDFCAEVAKVIAPVAVQMLFVFDADEKSNDFRKGVQEASHDRAEFLPVRELENLFLEPELLHRGLVALCELEGLEAPGLETIRAKFDELLDSRDDRDLYPQGTSPEDNVLKVVRGYSLLKRLWWDLVVADYDKVCDGERLVKAALDTESDALEPLVEILDRIVKS
jgi:predicted ATPase